MLQLGERCRERRKRTPQRFERVQAQSMTGERPEHVERGEHDEPRDETLLQHAQPAVKKSATR